MSVLRSYCEKALDGRIAACRKLKTECEKLIFDLDNPGRWHFDEDIARRHIEFISRFCKTPSGKIGTPLKLEEFQIARLEAVFGFVDDSDIRRYNELLIIEGRKNGKTTESSAIMLDMLCNDREGSPQIVSAATQLDQAKLTFNAALKMVRQSPQLSSHIKKRAADLYFPQNMGTIRALASNTNALDGLDLHCCVIDELAAIKNRDLFDLLKQSMGARRQPLLIQITTNGFVRNGIFDAQYDYASKILSGEAENERFLPFIYELDDPSEWEDENAWIKANPGLDTIKSRQYLRECVQKAKDDPSFKPTVLVKDFNLKQTSESSWLTFEETASPATPAELLGAYKFDYCFAGFDAADTTDLNAATVLCVREGDDHIYRRSMYWIPESVLEDEEKNGIRRGRDAAPYRLWIDQGWMRTCPGNKCEKHIFLDWLREIKYDEDLYPMYVGFDPWHISDELLAEMKGEFGPNSMIPVRQGAISLSEPMKNLKADLQAGRVIYDNPIDQWCLINTHIKTDVNGNIQPVKSLDRTQRIDGTAAFLCAYRVMMDHKGELLKYNEPAPAQETNE